MSLLCKDFRACLVVHRCLATSSGTLTSALILALPAGRGTDRRGVRMTKRRSRGDGSVYFDAANQTWIGALDLGRDATGVRRRLKVSGRTKTMALRRVT